MLKESKKPKVKPKVKEKRKRYDFHTKLSRVQKFSKDNNRIALRTAIPLFLVNDLELDDSKYFKWKKSGSKISIEVVNEVRE